MKDHDKLHISPSDKRDLKILWDEMDRLQYQCKEKLLHNMTLTMPGTIIENLNRLQFEEELTDSQIDRLLKNGIRLQCPQELHDLKDRMDKIARTFVEFFEEECRNADGGRWVIAESDIDDARNYVVLRTLHETLLLFDVDLEKLTT